MAVREKNRSKQAEVRQYSQVQVRFLLGSFQLCSRVFFPKGSCELKGSTTNKGGRNMEGLGYKGPPGWKQ